MPKKTRKSLDNESKHISVRIAENEKRRLREELLKPLDIEEFFPEGHLAINKRTCQGVQCNLCVEACPTNALYWKRGEIEITEELCIYCGACVLSCIVDDCLEITRRRPTGKVERFSRPCDFVTLQHSINARKRFEKIKEVFPTPEDYIGYLKKRR